MFLIMFLAGMFLMVMCIRFVVGGFSSVEVTAGVVEVAWANNVFLCCGLEGDWWSALVESLLCCVFHFSFQ